MSLSPDQQEDVANFQACVGNYDVDTAIRYLQSHGWDLMPAVNAYMAEHGSAHSDFHSSSLEPFSQSSSLTPSSTSSSSSSSSSSKAASASASTYETLRPASQTLESPPRAAARAASAVSSSSSSSTRRAAPASSSSSSSPSASTVDSTSYTGLYLRHYLSKLPGATVVGSALKSVGGWMWKFLPNLLQNAWTRSSAPFAERYATLYGEEHPPFLFHLRYTQAAREAQQANRALFIYLHSELHQDTPAFCSETLASPDVIQLLESRFVCWIGNTREPEAYRVAGSLGPMAYPFCCILTPSNSNNNQFELLGRMDGTLPADKFLKWAREILDAHDARLAVMLSDRFEQDACLAFLCSKSKKRKVDDDEPIAIIRDRVQDEIEPGHFYVAQDQQPMQMQDFMMEEDIEEYLALIQERSLREMQQSEFEQAVQADIERERREAEEERLAREAQEASERKAQEEEREREAEARRILEEEERKHAEAEAVVQQRQQTLDSLPLEPAVADKAAVALQLRLPDGRQVSRRFLNSELMKTIFVFVEAQELNDVNGQPIQRWEVVAHYPKRVLSDPNVTLKEAGLLGRAVLFVQEVVVA